MKITSDTLARTICLGIALLNQILAIFGKNVLPFAEDDVYQFVSVLFTIITAGIAWWRNNSFTKNAIAADEYKNLLKNEDKENAK